MSAGAPTYFALFELPERLVLDGADLAARYHALARAHHPDRFATRGADLQAAAAARMELVNRAYRTLRDPWERLRYVLARHDVTPGGNPLPEPLADEYFELQELSAALTEADQRDEAIARLTELRAKLKHLATEWERRLEALAGEHDAHAEGERQGHRERLAGLVGEISYLRAMRRDLDGRFMAAGV